MFSRPAARGGAAARGAARGGPAGRGGPASRGAATPKVTPHFHPQSKQCVHKSTLNTLGKPTV